MQHITLTTGDVYTSRRDEVDDNVVVGLQPLLSTMIAGKSALIPGGAGDFTLRGVAVGRCFVATVYGITTSKGPVPLLTMGVTANEEYAARLWSDLHRSLSVPVVTDPDSPPVEVPWCAVRLDIGAKLQSEDLYWLADFERCLAWAFLERH